MNVYHQTLFFFLQRMELDREDIDFLEKVLQYCNDKSYPSGASKNEKRVIRRKAERFEITSAGEILHQRKAIRCINTLGVKRVIILCKSKGNLLMNSLFINPT